MTITKPFWLRRGLSLLLTLSVLLGIGVVSAFATDSDTTCPTPEFYEPYGSVSLEGYWLSTLTVGVDAVTNGGSRTSGYTYYYTVDGSEPSATNGTKTSSPTINSTVMAKATDGKLTYKIIATKSGLENSAVATYETETPGDNAAFLDETFKSLICKALGKTYFRTKEISKTDMAALTEFSAENAGITDITGLETAVNLVSLDLSGNALDDHRRPTSNFSGFFQNFSAFTKLEHLDLSNCRLGDNTLGVSGSVAGMAYYFRMFLQNLPSIQTIDLSNNDLTGYFQFYYNGRYENLVSLDLSGNRLNQITDFEPDMFPKLENLDLSDNYLYWNEDAGTWIEPLMLAGDLVNHADQKNNATLAFVQQINKVSSTESGNSYTYIQVDDENKTLTLDDFAGETEISFMGYTEELMTKVTIQDTKVTAASISSPYSISTDNMLYTLSGYEPGSYELPVTVMHLGGDTETYTLKFTVYDVPSGTSGESAGITDPYLQEVICSKLGQTASTYDVTKADMASLTGTLSVINVTDAEGIQYAAGLTTLKLTGTFTDVPDLSGLISLKTLSLRSDELQTAPDLSALTALTTLTLSAADNGFPNLANQTALKTLSLDDIGAAAYPANLSSTITSFGIYGANDAAYGIPATLTKLTSLYFYPNIDSLGHETGTNYSAVLDLSGMTAVAAADSLSVHATSGARAIGLSSASTALKNFSLYMDASQSWPEGLEDVPNLSGYLRFYNVTGGNLPDEYANLKNVTRLILTGSFPDVPEEVASMTSLAYLTMESVGMTQFTTDLSNTALINLDLWGDTLTKMPDANLLPATLTTIDLSGNLISSVNSETGTEYAKFTALTTLELDSNPLIVFPSELIQNLPSLTTFTARLCRYTYIPADTFENSAKLKSLTLGDQLLISNDSAGNLYFSADAQTNEAVTAAAIATWQSVSGVTTMPSIITGGAADYARLSALDSSIGTVSGDPYTATALSLSVPEGTESLTLTPTAILSDTAVIVNGVTYTSGEAIPISGLVTGTNPITLTCTNAYQNFLTTDTEVTYTLTVSVGNAIDEDSMQEGRAYNIKYRIYKNDQTAFSMADNFFTKSATVKYKNGRYEVQFTTTNSGYIRDMHYYLNGELLTADLVEKDDATGYATYRMYVNSLTDKAVINPYVVPMGYAPKCDLAFDLTEIIDITDTLPATDTTDLTAAVNTASAITNTIYTDESFAALTDAIASAQSVLGDAAATQDEIDEQTTLLSAAIDGLTVDADKLADKTALQTAIEEASALEKGNHTDTAWTALQSAIADAQTIYDTLEATQSEADLAAKALNTAVTLFNSSGDASDLDKNNLADGIYFISIDMIKMNRSENSMANNAINHTAKLEVIDGVYYVTLDFKGITIDNRFGYLSKLSYYDEDYTYTQYGGVTGTLVDAEVLSTQKDSDGSDIIDQYNDENSLYPDLVRVKLVSTAIADADGYVPLHVFVPIMDAISSGSGDQDVLMKMDWTTLKKTTADDPEIQPEDPVEQSPAVDATDTATGIQVHADEGVFDEGAQLVVSELTSGTTYEAARAALSNIGTQFKLYDVSFTDVDGNTVQPNGTVQVSYPIPDGYDAGKVALYRINDDGTRTLINGTAADGYYTVITKSFSVYALVEKSDAQDSGSNSGSSQINSSSDTDNSTGNTISNGSSDVSSDSSDNTGSDASMNSDNTTSGTGANPKTGDSAAPYASLTIMLFAGAAAVLTAARRRKAKQGE